MDLDAITERFAERGYAVVDGLLSESDLERINDLMDETWEDRPDEWHEHEPGVFSNYSLLRRYPHEMDDLIRTPEVIDLCGRILGEDLRFTRWDVREIRPDVVDDCDLAHHRDISFYGKEAAGKLWDPWSRYRSRIACIIVYLSDVYDCCPTFSMVPDSHEYHSYETARESLGDDYEADDIRGEAGTAVVYNITEYHKRKAGRPDCPHGRRTMHLHYAQSSSPPMTKWYTLPEELAMSDDPETRRFYSLWSPEQIEYAAENYDEVPPYYYRGNA